MMRTVRTVSVIGVILIALTTTTVVWAFGNPQMPANVYVFNGQGDGFDYNAQALIWQNLGLLNADGSPGTVQANGDIHNSKGVRVGEVIRDGNNTIIGYRNADGTAEAYDVSVNSTDATIAHAWDRVADNGTIHVIKHGSSYATEANDVVTEHDGGGQQGDRGKTYDGYKDSQNGGDGTGVGYQCPDGTTASGAYCLTARAGANITFNANGCHTSNDPDANDNNVGSVTDSLGNVKGVTTVTGNDDVIIAGLVWVLKGDGPQTTAGLTALRIAARASGNRQEDGSVTDDDIANYISDLPFTTRWATLTALLGPSGSTINITYAKAPEGAGPGGSTTCPYQGDAFPFESIYMQDTDPTGLNAALIIPPNALLGPTWFHIVRRSEVPPLPPGLFIASGYYDFRLLEQPTPVAGPLIYVLETDMDPLFAQPFFYDDNAEFWQPLVADFIDGQQVFFQSEQVGLFALLTIEQPNTPCPGNTNGDSDINIFDLLDVLNAWGGCQLPCPPLCIGDVNDDCAVNVFDLLLVLQNWGPCI